MNIYEKMQTKINTKHSSMGSEYSSKKILKCKKYMPSESQATLNLYNNKSSKQYSSKLEDTD
jgi:hypothetical protein